MDHLRMPPDPQQPIIIPYYESEYEFDGGDLLMFPGRCRKTFGDFIVNKDQYLDRRSLQEFNNFITTLNSKQPVEWKVKHEYILDRLVRGIEIISGALISDRESGKESYRSSFDEAMQETENGTSYRSPSWIDINLGQAARYIQIYAHDYAGDQDGEIAAYCWKEIFINLVFHIPMGPRADKYGSGNELNHVGDKPAAMTADALDSGYVNLQAFPATSEAAANLEVLALNEKPMSQDNTELRFKTSSLTELDILSKDFVGLMLRSIDDILPGTVRQIFEEVDSDAKMAFLEQWLFFGTLQTAFNIVDVEIDLEKYVATNSAQRVLTTASLEDDMRVWETTERNREDDHTTRQLKLRQILVDVMGCVTGLDSAGVSEKISDFLTVVHVLCVTLDWKAAEIYEERFEYKKKTSGADKEEVTKMFQSLIKRQNVETRVINMKNTWLEHKLVKAGWCPHQAKTLVESYSLILVYYIYLLGSLKTSHDTRKCSRITCALDEIKEYRTLHDSKCINGDLCKMLKMNSQAGPEDMGKPYTPDPTRLASIVEGGHIPLISFSHMIFRSILSLDLELEEFNPDDPVPYVAVSHVWADGMGNPNANSLPLCQLSALRILIPALTPEYYSDSRFHLWIDTLCIPVGPPKTRKAAIVSMRSVYKSAAIVLVLDSDLLQRPRPSDPVATLGLIVNSRWARRLWTFQEGALARNLCFAFSETSFVYMEDLYSEVQKEGGLFNPWPLFNINWWPSLGKEHDKMDELRSYVEHFESLPEAEESQEYLEEMKNMLYMMDTLNNDFSTIWNGISMRKTQKVEDEVICVASLLDLDLKVILENNSLIERRKRLFLLQRRIPISVLFIRMRRMLEDKFGWAPESFMGHTTRSGIRVKQAICTEAGLEVSSPGVIFKGNKIAITPNEKDYVFVITSSYRGKVEGQVVEANGAVSGVLPFRLRLSGLELQDGSEEVPIRDWSNIDPASYAIILPQPLISYDGNASSVVSHNTAGALVSVRADNDGILVVRYLLQVNVTRGIVKPKDIPLNSAGISEETVEGEGNSEIEEHLRSKENSSKPETSNKSDNKSTLWEKTLGPLAATLPVAKVTLGNATLLPPEQKWCVE